jgi:hypothetical protein
VVFKLVDDLFFLFLNKCHEILLFSKRDLLPDPCLLPLGERDGVRKKKFLMDEELRLLDGPRKYLPSSALLLKWPQALPRVRTS